MQAWGLGFWVNHLMVPWISKDEVLDRQRTYDLARFKNEVLGLPTSLGDHAVTRAELERRCTERPMAGSLEDIPHEFRSRLTLGIDWGGGGVLRTVVVMGYMGAMTTRSTRAYFARYQAYGATSEPVPWASLLSSQRKKKFVWNVCEKYRVIASFGVSCSNSTSPVCTSRFSRGSRIA